MRNLGASPYLENPELIETKAVDAPDKSGTRVNEFSMNIGIKRARSEEASGKGAPAKAAAKRPRNRSGNKISPYIVNGKMSFVEGPSMALCSGAFLCPNC